MSSEAWRRSRSERHLQTAAERRSGEGHKPTTFAESARRRRAERVENGHRHAYLRPVSRPVAYASISRRVQVTSISSWDLGAAPQRDVQAMYLYYKHVRVQVYACQEIEQGDSVRDLYCKP
jgi:hypothetical protein